MKATYAPRLCVASSPAAGQANEDPDEGGGEVESQGDQQAHAEDETGSIRVGQRARKAPEPL